MIIVNTFPIAAFNHLSAGWRIMGTISLKTL